MWGSIMRKMDRGTGNGAEQNAKKEEKVVKAEEQVKEIDNKNEHEAIKEAKQSEPPTVAEPEQPKIMRRNSEVTLSFESRANKNQKLLKRSSEGMPQKGWDKTPTILFTDHDASPTSRHREMNQQPVKRHSNSSMTEVVVNDLIRQRDNEGFKSSAEEMTTQIPNHTTGEPSQENTGSSSLSSGEFRVGEKRTDDTTRNEVAKEHRGLLKKSNDVCIEIEAPGETDANVFPLNTPYEFARISNPTFSRSDSSSSCPSPRPEGEAAHRITPQPNQDLEVTSFNVGDAHPEMTSSASDTFLKSSLAVPQSTEGGGVVGSQAKTGHFLTGMAKTFHKWRTKTKKKKHFNYEKYITYLESILPTVGFSVGGVIITWNGIYTFIVIMTFLVGVFAQEAFFGK
ncbi:predicted protein [Nematostella vectensis]|uniref:Uncharacterized protein n=2 Tax=Nematostella vectensis TaxID=45351 RepID=A7SZJ4_NEMVE|nr:predicted protein [Nematostella vectensis]|eukprot:XP_001622981.1 predicted protein [Nematostella vectensis]